MAFPQIQHICSQKVKITGVNNEATKLLFSMPVEKPAAVRETDGPATVVIQILTHTYEIKLQDSWFLC